jgi:hypothetical protein
VKICYNIGRLHYGGNLRLTIGGLYEKDAVQGGFLGTNSAFPLGPRKITESFDRIDLSQELPGANSFLGISPAALRKCELC